MTIITFPDYAKISEIQFARGTIASKGVSKYTGRRQTAVHAGKILRASVSIVPLTEADLRAFDGFFMNLNGPENTFLLGAERTRGGTGGGTILINGASETGATVSVDGMTPSETGVLLEGDFCSIESRLYGVTSQLDADGSGEGSLAVWPNVRLAPADNAVVETATPRGEFRLLDDFSPPSGLTSDGVSAPFSFECEAVV